jgi:myo-inositol 2-dehydrogenase/D-chiro-inositol 1-dehydrogenase
MGGWPRERFVTMKNEPIERFRLGLVGAGRMGRNHLEAIKDSARISLAAVTEPRDDVRLALAGEGYEVFVTLEEMLDETELDGVVVAVPTGHHLALVRQLMAAGMAVLCEKPCGINVGEAQECARSAAEADCLLQVAYWRRFVPGLQALRDAIGSGALGEILAVNCYQWDATPPPIQFRDASGGIFLDMGVHEFDQVRWLTGQEFTTLKAVSSELAASAGDPDCGQLVAKLDGGTTAVVSLGRWHPDGDSCKVEVFGTSGSESVWFLRPDGGDAVFRNALRLQAEDFARAVAGAPGGGATVDDAVVALSVASRASEAVAVDGPS